MVFAWDPKKEATNLQNHGVSFTDAKLAFQDPHAVAVLDEPHSPRGKHELRWWLLGKVGARIMTVRYTHRSNGVIRIIGAAFWREGVEIYEKENPPY